MRPSRVFLYFCLCFITGVALRSFFSFDIFWAYVFLLGILVLLIFVWSNRFWKIIILGGIFLFLGVLRYQLSLPKNTPDFISFYNSQYLLFQGVVSQEPDIRLNHIKLTISKIKLSQPFNSAPLDFARDRQGRQNLKGKILVTTRLYPEYQYGDLLEIDCQLQKPKPISDFFYDRYLAKSDIYSLCYYPEINLITQGKGNYFLTQIFKFKNKLQSVINFNLPEPQASLLSALLLGSRRGIPAELIDKFSITGTMHLIAISGLHITILIAILMVLANNLYISRPKAFYLITVILIIYVTLIGFPPSAVRAAIMGWLIILAMKIGRLNKAINSIILAASLMILVTPKILGAIGFQLSFSAVLGLIYFYPYFQRWLNFLPSVLGLKEIFQMTLSAQIMTLPLVVYNFGRLSLIAPIANILILSIFPYLMALGFFSLLVGLFSLSLSLPLFWLIYLFLSYLIKVVEIFAEIPFATLEVTQYNWLILLFGYLLIFSLFRWVKKIQRAKI